MVSTAILGMVVLVTGQFPSTSEGRVSTEVVEVRWHLLSGAWARAIGLILLAPLLIWLLMLGPRPQDNAERFANLRYDLQLGAAWVVPFVVAAALNWATRGRA